MQGVHRRARLPVWLPLLAALLVIQAAAAAPFWHRPVKVVAPDRMTITTDRGSGAMPLFLSADWTRPQPGITRAVIVMHGIDRAAAITMRGAEAARAAAGPAGAQTLLIVPQFLIPADIAASHLPADTLRWSVDGWPGGEPALGPIPVSSFTVFDAILRHLADRTLFPALTEIVVAGHSAGGQVVQRYAVVGHPIPALATEHIQVRYVVANPSSYLYFSDDRPAPVDPAVCPNFDRWKFGLRDVPPYVHATAGLEARYAARDVTYLLGTADTDPNHKALDKSCAAEAEGPYRLARGEAYFAYMRRRHPGLLNQRLVLVPGVGHSGVKMFGSPCGMAVVFNLPGCPGWPVRHGGG